MPSSAELAEIKAAYRHKALALHPDVNPADDAAQRFAEVSGAYGAPHSGGFPHEGRSGGDS